MQAVHSGKPVNPMPWYAQRAILKLNSYREDKDGSNEQRLSENVQMVADTLLNEENKFKLYILSTFTKKKHNENYDTTPHHYITYCFFFLQL